MRKTERCLLLLLGAPGSGKGTQGRLLASHFKVPHISTGELVRELVEKRDSVGLALEAGNRTGELAPDEVMLTVLTGRLQQGDCHTGAVVDGFPRTAQQADGLCRSPYGRSSMIVAVQIEVSDEVVRQRLSKRWVCPQCGYAVGVRAQHDSPVGRCVADGTRLVQRADDVEAVLTRRLTRYKREGGTALATLIEDGCEVVRVDGSGPPEPVFRRILGEIKRVKRD